MPFNPFRRPASARPVQEREFTDSETGETFTVCLRRLNGPEQNQAYEDGLKLIETYLTGTVDTPKIDFPSLRLPKGERQPVITETQFFQMASLAKMQPEASPDRWRAEDFIAMSAVLPPYDWARVMAFMNEVAGGASPKNAVRQGLKENSDSASNTTEDTPSSTSEETPSSSTSVDAPEPSV